MSIALFVYRGETKELDNLLGRSEMALINSKDMLIRISKEKEFKNTIFIAANTVLGNRRYEAYMDSIAQEAVARSFKWMMSEEMGLRTQKNGLSNGLMKSLIPEWQMLFLEGIVFIFRLISAINISKITILGLFSDMVWIIYLYLQLMVTADKQKGCRTCFICINQD